MMAGPHAARALLSADSIRTAGKTAAENIDLKLRGTNYDWSGLVLLGQMLGGLLWKIFCEFIQQTQLHPKIAFL